MLDPGEEFRKLAEAVGQMRQEVATALDRAAPDYRRDLAQLFTVLQAIEKKPALSASVGALDAAAAEGGRKGAADAANALRSAQRAFEEAQERAGEYVHRLDSLSWQVWGVLIVLVLFCGVSAGVFFGVRALPSSVIATEAGCGFAGGAYTPAKPPQQMAPACVFWGERVQ